MLNKNKLLRKALNNIILSKCIRILIRKEGDLMMLPAAGTCVNQKVNITTAR